MWTRQATLACLDVRVCVCNHRQDSGGTHREDSHLRAPPRYIQQILKKQMPVLRIITCFSPPLFSEVYCWKITLAYSTLTVLPSKLMEKKKKKEHSPNTQLGGRNSLTCSCFNQSKTGQTKAWKEIEGFSAPGIPPLGSWEWFLLTDGFSSLTRK